MKRRYHLLLRISLVAAVVASLFSNLRQTLVTDRKEDWRDGAPQTSLRPWIVGVACSEDWQQAILRTYLSQSPSKHSFDRKWLSDVENIVHTEHLDTLNPFILWVTGPTLLYPPYWIATFDEIESAYPSTPRLVGETLPIQCDGITPRNSRITCVRLSGEVFFASYEAIAASSACRDKYSSSTEETVSIPPILAHSPECWDSAVSVEVPKQYRIPGADIFKYEEFWEKLVSLNNLPVHVDFVTAKFGRDSKFRLQVEAAADAIRRFGASSQRIHAYLDFPEYILQDKRWSPHLAFLYNSSLVPKGAGYWFWKAPLMLHHLERVSRNDMVAFADADLPDHFKWMVPLMEEMIATKSTLALYQVEYADQNYTKRDVWNELCPDRDATNDYSKQYAGGWMVVQKTPGTIQFLQQWQTFKSDYHLLNDEPSVLPNLPGFKYNLHDQSILSLLMKCRYEGSYLRRQVFEGASSLKDWSVHMFQI
eukprot:Nitzschia sp. Nitz4//scaffold51_size120721//91338//92855//NITZ4_003741-RA/size120721-snap-gene-0.43-mRNA-1//-1//CDS//3329553904//2322//frame0